MTRMTVANAKAHFSEMLDQVEAGEEIVITKHGQPVARIVGLHMKQKPLPKKKLEAFRASLPSGQTPSAVLLRQLREEGY